MTVTEASIVPVIARASAMIGDAKYVSGEVDRLAAAQPAIAQYVMAHQKELAVDGVVTVLFQVALIVECIRVATGQPPARVGYAALDAAARVAPTLESLAESEPDLASFIASNVELGGARNGLALGLLAHAARALLGG
jgi:hypothetical protein